MMTFWKMVCAVTCGLVPGLMASSVVSQETKKQIEIPLKLLETDVITSGLTPCYFSIWQHNRDPKTDKYAYLLHMAYGDDGAPIEALVKIGPDVLGLEQIARDGEDIGAVSRHFLFASQDRETRVHVEILEARDVGGASEIDRATVYVVQDDKVPFQARGKGIFGCPDSVRADASAANAEASETPVAAPVAANAWSGPTGIPFGAAQMLATNADVPVALARQLRDYAYDDCDLDGPTPWSGAKYVVSDYYVLWELPCFFGAYQGSSVFAVTQNPPQDWAELLTLPNPPGLEGNQNYGAMNTQVLSDIGLIRTTELSRGVGDCGVHQVFRLTDGPGEVLELELLEYREKIDCDGVVTEPGTWPVAYRNY